MIEEINFQRLIFTCDSSPWNESSHVAEFVARVARICNDKRHIPEMTDSILVEEDSLHTAHDLHRVHMAHSLHGTDDEEDHDPEDNMQNNHNNPFLPLLLDLRLY